MSFFATAVNDGEYFDCSYDCNPITWLCDQQCIGKEKNKHEAVGVFGDGYGTCHGNKYD